MLRITTFALAAFLLFGAPAMAEYRAFGDSLPAGSGANDPVTTNGFVGQISAAFGVPITRLAHGGDMVGDQIAKAYTVNPVAGDVSIISMRVNDQRVYGVDATKQAYSADGLRALIGWLAIGSKQTARSVGGETGTWSNTGILGVGRATTQVGSIKTFTVSGTVAYLSMLIVDTGGVGANYSLQVDGGAPQNFSASAPGVSSPLSRPNLPNGNPDPWPYTDRLHRFAGLSAGSHTIKVTMTGPGNLYVQWAAGNDQTIKPKVFVGNTIRASNAPGLGYTFSPNLPGGNDANVAAYNADTAQIVADFISDGFAVSLVDTAAVVNQTTDLNAVDGIHPTQSGHDKMGAAFITAMTPPPLTFAPVSAYFGSDGKFYIGDPPNRRQINLVQ